MAFVSLIFAILFSFSASASWNPGAISYANRNFGYFPGPQSLPLATRGHLATVYGGGMRELRFREDLRNDELKLKIPDMFQKEIKVFLRKQNRRAPLLVFIPGVFDNADTAIARGTVKWFSDMGYHVLTMPNCWSPDFAKARPIYREEYPGGEASAFLKITKLVIAQNLGAQNISEVHIMGESLGALTAAVVYSKDSNSAHPVFTGGATLTWPPIVLHEAMARIDRLMAATDSLYEAKCESSIKRLKTKWRIMRGRYILHPTQEEIECAPAVVAQYSFRKQLVKLAKTISDAEHLGKSPSEQLTFRLFINGYAPRYKAALSSSDRYGSLEYWLNKADPRAARNVRILTSEDDFLNENMSWNFPGLLGPRDSQIIIAHWGGHIGLTDTKEYEGLLRAQFTR